VTSVRKRTCDVAEKRHFIAKVSYKKFFRAGLNEIKYDHVDSKQHFYLQYHVAETDIKALCKKQTSCQAVAYLGFLAAGDNLSSGAPNLTVRGSIKQKKHWNLMLYLQLPNSKDKVFLLLLLKIYRFFCQKADMI